ncbi:MAG: hypothetical protein R2832_19475 [Rhodothermales bacterium]
MTLILKHSDLLTRDTVNALLDAKGGPHVSIYMPAHREWSAVHHDPIRLKNLLREARDKLVDTGMRPPDATEFLSEACDLVERDNFWQYQSDGLVLFISAEEFRYYRLPLNVEDIVILADRYYLKPLFELFADDGRFYVLSLSEGSVALHQCSRHSIREVELADTSLSLEESARFDDVERSVNLHAGLSSARATGKANAAVFHGTGAGDGSVHQTQLQTFLNELENAVQKALAQETAPLVLVGNAKMRGAYLLQNRYRNVAEESVNVDPAHMSREEMHALSYECVKPVFARMREDATRAFEQFSGPGSMHLASDIESVLSAAYQHRVSKLFLPRGRYVWGRFDPLSGSVQVHHEMRRGDLELLDLAAAYTLLGNGEVYAVSDDEMPEEASVAAVLRY